LKMVTVIIRKKATN